MYKETCEDKDNEKDKDKDKENEKENEKETCEENEKETCEENDSMIEDMFIDLFKELSPSKIKKFIEPLFSFFQEYIKIYTYLFFIILLLLLITNSIILFVVLSR